MEDTRVNNVVKSKKIRYVLVFIISFLYVPNFDHSIN